MLFLRLIDMNLFLLRYVPIDFLGSNNTFQIFQPHSRAVNEAFVELFDSGLIYRGNFLVNWSTKLQSAISDIEVDHVEVTKKTKLTVHGLEKPVEVGLIYDVAYKIFDGKGKNPLSSYSFGGIRTADFFLFLVHLHQASWPPVTAKCRTMSLALI